MMNRATHDVLPRAIAWRRLALLSALLGLGLVPAVARAEDDVIVIKLGTLAPQGSPWHTLLKEGAERFKEISGGKVVLRIFAGGTMGNEGDMVKKMRIGQIQAAGLSTVGLHEISPEPMALDMPLVIRSYEEKDYVLEHIGPKMAEAMAKKGYILLNWSDIGFIRFFTTEPRPTLDKMRAGKLFAWEGDPASVEAWKAGGFHPVVLSATDIIPSMQTGMIDTVAYPPTYALSIRLTEKAKYMEDLILGSFTAGLVMDKKTWERIPADLRPKLLEVARDLGLHTTREARKMEDESLKKMKAQGVTVVHVTDPDAWTRVIESNYDKVRGKVVPAETFDEVLRLAKEYRSQHSK